MNEMTFKPLSSQFNWQAAKGSLLRGNGDCSRREKKDKEKKNGRPSPRHLME